MARRSFFVFFLFSNKEGGGGSAFLEFSNNFFFFETFPKYCYCTIVAIIPAVYIVKVMIVEKKNPLCPQHSLFFIQQL